jgi:hypothetical protein
VTYNYQANRSNSVNSRKVNSACCFDQPTPTQPGRPLPRVGDIQSLSLSRKQQNTSDQINLIHEPSSLFFLCTSKFLHIKQIPLQLRPSINSRIDQLEIVNRQHQKCQPSGLFPGAVLADEINTLSRFLKMRRK